MRKAPTVELSEEELKQLIRRLYEAFPTYAIGSSLSDFENRVVARVKCMRASELHRLTRLLSILYSYADCAEEPFARETDLLPAITPQTVAATLRVPVWE